MGKSMPVLVTGGLGFVGINLVLALADEGETVVCADLGPPDEAARRFLAPVADRVVHVVADLTARGALAAAVAECGVALDGVIHAAALTATTLAVERDSAGLLVATNIGGTMEALGLAAAQRCRRFVYVSSPSALGPVADVQAPLDESYPAAPVALYGQTKLASEQLCRRYAALTGLSIVAVRIAQPYGPMERRTSTRVRTSPIHEWVAAALAGEELLVGDPSVARDWTAIEDTARGILLAFRTENPRHDLYHLGVGRTFAVGAIIDALREDFPALRIRTDISPEDEELNPNIAPGAVRGALTIDRIRDDLGYVPQFDLASGLARYLAWVRSAEGVV
jgi:nucleoside-diphosphate-sugar epimerase